MASEDDECLVYDTIEEFTKQFCLAFDDLNVEGNTLLCPFSLSVMLTIMKSGARGSTAEEIRAAMNIPADVDEEKLLHGYKYVLRALTEPLEEPHHWSYDVNVYSTFSLPRGIKLTETYRRKVEDSLFFNIELHDGFNSNGGQKKSGGAQGWKLFRTFEENDARPADEQQSKTVNLIHEIQFNIDWVSPFCRHHTLSADFFLSATKVIEASFMRQAGLKIFTHSVDEIGAKLILFPTKNSQISLLIVLPTDVEGLLQVKERLQYFDLLDLVQDLKPTNATVFLPKFKIHFTSPSKDILQKMGVQRVFDIEKSDLSNASHGVEEFSFDSIDHNDYFEISEWGIGTEAAQMDPLPLQAETSWKEQGTNYRRASVFKIDRPFLFAVLDTGHFKSPMNVLFFGSVINPMDGVS